MTRATTSAKRRQTLRRFAAFFPPSGATSHVTLVRISLGRSSRLVGGVASIVCKGPTYRSSGGRRDGAKGRGARVGSEATVAEERVKRCAASGEGRVHSLGSSESTSAVRRIARKPRPGLITRLRPPEQGCWRAERVRGVAEGEVEIATRSSVLEQSYVLVRVQEARAVESSLDLQPRHRTFRLLTRNALDITPGQLSLGLARSRSPKSLDGDRTSFRRAGGWSEQRSNRRDCRWGKERRR